MSKRIVNERARAAMARGQRRREDPDTKVIVSCARWQAREIAAGLRARAEWHEKQGSAMLARRLRDLACVCDKT